MSARRATAIVTLTLLLSALAACRTGNTATVAGPSASPPRKVLVIAEENHTYEQVIGSPQAPYLTKLAARYGSATDMTANYPVECPSLPAYILITSGSTGGICDDNLPSVHMLTGDNVFAQVAAAHLSSRTYGQHMPGPCARANTADGVFLVRHTPVAYYTSETTRCPAEDLPMGSPTSGALHRDIAAGTLPAYAFVTPDACHDMHGAPSCPDHNVADGDTWLSQWIPRLLAGADYRAGRLVIVITWDEGSQTSNHIPTLVISPSTNRIASGTAFDDCSTLRTVEDVLRLAPLGCASKATSMVSAFHL